MNRQEAPAMPSSIVIAAEEGTVLQAFGDTVQVKLAGKQTQGSLTVLLDSTPPGGGPPPHIHYQEDELFLIIEGQYRFLANGQWTDVVGAGTAVYTPRGALHTFQNVGDTPCRHWIVATPSGFEQFFAQCAAVFAQASPPDMARILAISEEHGLEFVPPLASEPPASA